MRIPTKQSILFWICMVASVPCHAFDIDNLLKEGAQLFTAAKYTNALDKYAEILSLAPHNQEALVKHGLCALYLHKHSLAEKDFDTAASLYPNNSISHYGRAVCQFVDKDFTTAILELNTSIALDPSNVPAYLLRHWYYKRLGKAKEADADLNDALTQTTSDPVFLYTRGVYYHEKENFAAAISTFKDILKLAPDHFNAAYMLAGCYYAQEKYDSALDTMSKLLDRYPDSAQLNYHIAQIYFIKKDIEKANYYIDHSLYYNNRFPAARLMRGMIALESDMPETASDDLMFSLNEHPNSSYTSFQYALFLYKLGRQEEAMTYLDEMSKKFPSDPDMLALRGNFFINIHKYNLAKIELAKAILLSPDKPGLLNNYAWALMHLGEYAQALKNVNRSLELNPESAAALDTRANIYQLLGRRAEAIGDYQKVIAMDSGTNETKRKLALLLNSK